MHEHLERLHKENKVQQAIFYIIVHHKLRLRFPTPKTCLMILKQEHKVEPKGQRMLRSVTLRCEGG